MWSVTCVALYTTIIVVLCGIFGLNTEFEVNKPNDGLSTALLFGGLLSVLSAGLVVFSYITNKQLRRHPNHLIFWKSLTDVCIGIRFMVSAAYPPSTLIEATVASPCRNFAIITQFCFTGSELWYLAYSVELFRVMRNPFASERTAVYHLFIWGASAFITFRLVWTEAYGYNRMCFCWVDWEGVAIEERKKQCVERTPLAGENLDDFNTNNIWFIYFWLFVVNFYGVAAMFMGYTRLAFGLQATFEARRKLLQNILKTVGVLTGM